MHRRYSSPGGSILAADKNETLEFLKAWVGTSFAFAVFISAGFIFDTQFLINLLIAALTCGIGFVLHELAHRVAARRFGSEAHFMSNDGMLLVSILVAFIGWFIAAPGAVWHRPLSTEKSGIIAIVGPLSNLLLAALFYLLLSAAPALGLSGILLSTVFIGFQINAWLGLFNMIPADPFDGGKVWRWNKVAFGLMAAVAVVMVFVL